MASNVLAGQAPVIDPRVEFWSDPYRWPRETVRHGFLARIVHDLGRLVYRDAWTGDEPSTAILHPIRPVHDTATPPSDVDWAVQLLYSFHAGFKAKADGAIAAGDPVPLPTIDEWPIAHALSRQLADTSWAAFKRFCDVTVTLTTLFELGLVTAARRQHIYGYPEPIPPSHWINEVYPSWFSTCQIDPEQPFCGIPIREGGDWIYVELEGYFAWRNASFGFSALTDGKAQSVDSNPYGSGASASDVEAQTADQMKSANSQAPSRRRAGAKPRYDWPSFDEEVLARAASDEDRPASVHAFADAMLFWCSENWDTEPAKSTARTRIAKIIAENGLSLT